MPASTTYELIGHVVHMVCICLQLMLLSLFDDAHFLSMLLICLSPLFIHHLQTHQHTHKPNYNLKSQHLPYSHLIGSILPNVCTVTKSAKAPEITTPSTWSCLPTISPRLSRFIHPESNSSLSCTVFTGTPASPESGLRPWRRSGGGKLWPILSVVSGRCAAEGSCRSGRS